MVFPTGNPDDREMLLMWLDYLWGAVIRKVEGLNEDDVRWTPEGRLIPLLGIVNHLTGRKSNGDGSTGRCWARR